MILRGVLDDRFRQLSGKKDLDPMRGEVGLAGSVPTPTTGRATANRSRFPAQRSRDTARLREVD